MVSPINGRGEVPFPEGSQARQELSGAALLSHVKGRTFKDIPLSEGAFGEPLSEEERAAFVENLKDFL